MDDLIIAIFGLFGSFGGLENLPKSKGFFFSAPGIFAKGDFIFGSFGILNTEGATPIGGFRDLVNFIDVAMYVYFITVPYYTTP